ncbi:hypothetical protein [Paenibacillus periandrae]|uniref:hypothetical protein n=1 Tax=Paenibacillus periandrae TaxID=1761741 RepID=UPI001F08C0F0|nr:hypothetical protein [Paenibacillus periandrae]
MDLTKPYWLLDQIEPAAQSPQVLEFGCGSGLLWMVKADRIPVDCIWPYPITIVIYWWL